MSTLRRALTLLTVAAVPLFLCGTEPSPESRPSGQGPGQPGRVTISPTDLQLLQAALRSRNLPATGRVTGRRVGTKVFLAGWQEESRVFLAVYAEFKNQLTRQNFEKRCRDGAQGLKGMGAVTGAYVF